MLTGTGLVSSISSFGMTVWPSQKRERRRSRERGRRGKRENGRKAEGREGKGRGQIFQIISSFRERPLFFHTCISLTLT